MKRRIIAFLLALLLVISPVRSFAAENTTALTPAENERTFITEDGFHYQIVGEYTVIIDYNGTRIAGKGTELVIPSELGGYPVREIAYDAFSCCIELASVTVPETVTSIGYRAFQGCTYLESVNLPDTVMSIGHNAFEDCGKLRQVNIPASLATLETKLFSGCESLTKVTIPEGVTYIEVNVFSGCTGLTEIAIPASVTTLYSSAFTGCNALKGIFVDEGNQNYSNDSRGVLFNKAQTKLIRAPGGISGSYDVPDSAVTVAASAFSGCTGLTEVTFPETVTTMGDYVLRGCTALTNVVFPESIRTIPKGTFRDCTGLASVTIPEGCTALGSQAFEGCTGLTEANLPDGLSTIGEDAFRGCKTLTSVSFPESLTAIGKSAFNGCEKLAALDLPEGLDSIGDSAFQSCKALTKVDLPAQISELGAFAFFNCTGLTTVKLPESITVIPHAVFDGCKKLTDVTIPGTVTLIDAYAFSGCKVLKDMTLPESVIHIGDYAFYDCTGLKSVTLPEGLETIGIYAFQDCKMLEAVTIPASVRKIDFHAFGSCSKLTEIKFCGDAPELGLTATPFFGVKATAYYPNGNPTWTEDAMKKCGGKLTWAPYGGLPFTDVPVDSFYYDSVVWALDNGITTGTSDTAFSPEQSCNRAQVVTFLWRAAGSPEPSSSEHPFVDVEAGSFYEKAVLWAVETGITKGTDATHFSPDAPCNRATVVTFLFRAEPSPTVNRGASPFTDVTLDDWFAATVLWAVEQGITNGLTATQFGPDAICNRAQVVTFLYRACID